MIIFLLFSWGCNNDKNISTEDSKDNIEENNNETDENEPEDKDKNSNQSGVISPLSGVYSEENKVERRPVAIMFDNHKNARWQAGLSKAEIAYEYLVEGRITRYMGIYLINEPDTIGPVRSARPYFLSSLLEYDALYVHCGGSPEAKEDIKTLNIDEADCMSAPGYVFYRNSEVDKKAPHNLYTSMESIRKYEEEKGFNRESEYQSFTFNKEMMDIDGEKAEEISIEYDKDNITSYKYDKDLSLYIRYKDGKKHIDENDNTELTATNIIIQKVATEVIDDQGRLKIDTIGKGEGIYITKGKQINITWEKDLRDSKTIYYNEKGEEIKLNPGITWIQVTPLNPKLIIS